MPLRDDGAIVRGSRVTARFRVQNPNAQTALGFAASRLVFIRPDGRRVGSAEGPAQTIGPGGALDLVGGQAGGPGIVQLEDPTIPAGGLSGNWGIIAEVQPWVFDLASRTLVASGQWLSGPSGVFMVVEITSVEEVPLLTGEVLVLTTWSDGRVDGALTGSPIIPGISAPVLGA